MARRNQVSELDESEDKFFASGGKDGVKDVEIEEAKEEVKEEIKDEPKAEKSDRPRDETGKFLPKDEKKEESKERQVPEGYVPHGALHEERERRKKIEREIAEFKANAEAEKRRNEERWAALQEQWKPKPPTVQEDAVGHFQHRTQEIEQRLAQTQQETAQIRQLNAQQQQWQQFQTAYASAVNDYASRTPDYVAAHNHFINAIKAEIQAMGYEPQQAAHIAMQQETAIVAKAFQDGVNPGERIYGLAKLRGYGAQQPQPQVDTKAGAEKLEKIDQGQRASAATVSGGGKPKMTWQDIASMSDDEFKKLDWEKTIRGLAA